MSNQTQVIEKITYGSAVLFGTASRAISASYSISSSYSPGGTGVTDGGSYNISSSWASQSLSASYAPSTPSNTAISASWASKSLYSTPDDRNYSLTNYTRTILKTNLSGPADGVSGVTYSPPTNTIFAIRNSSAGNSGVYEYDLYGTLKRTITEVGAWDDTEGICWMSGSTFAVLEEDITAGGNAKIHVLPITPTTTQIHSASGSIYDTKIDLANLGPEGVTFDPDRNYIYYNTEKSSSLGNWDIWKIGLSGSAEAGITSSVFSLVTSGISNIITDCSDLHFDRDSQTFYLLSDESDKIIRTDYYGNIIETASIVGMTQPEGITLTPDRQSMFIVGEPLELSVFHRNDSYLPRFNSTASYAATASISLTASIATSSSYAITASYSLNGGSTGTSLGTGSTYPFTASWAESASYATTMSQLISYVVSSSFASSSITASYASTASYALNGGTGGGGGGNASGVGYINLPVQASKLPTTSSARIDAGDANWRLLFDAASNQSASYQFLVPTDYYNSPTASLTFAMNSLQSGTNAVIWKISIYIPSAEDIGIPTVATNIFTSSLTNNQAAGIPTYSNIPLTNNDTIGAGKYCWVNIERMASADADTATGDAELATFAFVYNTTAVFSASYAATSSYALTVRDPLVLDTLTASLMKGNVATIGAVETSGSNYLGFFGNGLVTKPTALSDVNSTDLSAYTTIYDGQYYPFEQSDAWANIQTVINNMRIRIGELETKLNSVGLLQ